MTRYRVQTKNRHEPSWRFTDDGLAYAHKTLARARKEARMWLTFHPTDYPDMKSRIVKVVITQTVVKGV